MPGLVRRGDVVLALSTSGNSANLLRGLEVAHGHGARTIGLVGGDGGRIARSPAVDLCLVVRSDSIHRVQETHVAAYHTLWDLVHSLLADDRGAKGIAP
jgi:D-sedoheptulose 7-phosphate isomerase